MQPEATPDLSGLQFRTVTSSDAETLFRWVNSPSSLSVKLRTARPIPWAAHLNWFSERLAANPPRIWIAEIDGQPAGQVRLEPEAGHLEIDIYVDPEMRRHSIGQSLVRWSQQQRNILWPDRTIVARVRSNNAGSLRLFKKAGFLCRDGSSSVWVFESPPA